MRLNESQAVLFNAFSAITARVFASNRLLACPTLSKAPNYGNVLRRFILGCPQSEPGCKSRLRIVFRYFLTNGAHFFFLLLSALYIRIIGWKLPEAALADPEKKLLLIDSFAVLPRIEKEGRYRELYLTGLADEAAEEGHSVVHLYRLYGSRNPRTLWNALKILSGQKGIIEAHLFTFSDWLRLLWHVVAYPFALWRLTRSLKAYPDASPQSYIRNALVYTAGQCVLIGEARRLAGFRLGLLLAARPFACFSAQRGNMPGPGTHIVSWYENQTVNKCFMRGLAEAEKKTGRHILVTGAQLSLWPPALLNNYPDDAEAALGLAPDRILVNGPHFLPENTRQKYAVGPSLRYASLFGRPGTEPSSAGNASVFEASICEASTEGAGKAAFTRDAMQKPLLVLLSYYPEEVKRVLQLALPLADDRVEVIYKFHPTARAEQFSAWLPLSPKIAEGPLGDTLEEIKARGGAVLGSVSGALVEAAVSGVPVLSVEEANPGLGMNFLPDYGKGFLWESVKSSRDVEDALEALSMHFSSPRRTQEVRALREMLFTEPTRQRIRADFLL